MAIEPFSMPFSQPAVDDLRARLGRTRWPDQIQGSTWEYGVDLQFLREICGYWRDQFDWKVQVEKLSAFHHYRYMADGFGIHFIHERGKGAPIPLILTHGWPGSFLEMLRIIPLLTDPANNGGDPSDSFDVVVPSMPGYGLSDRPVHRGLNTFAIAGLWAGLMNELGYSRFAAQGGDIGAGVSTVLGLRHAPQIIGIHLNYIPGSYRPPIEEGTKLEQVEEEFLKDASRWYDQHGAYAHVQGTHPQTAAYGLNDSPAALAASGASSASWLVGLRHHRSRLVCHERWLCMPPSSWKSFSRWRSKRVRDARTYRSETPGVDEDAAFDPTRLDYPIVYGQAQAQGKEHPVEHPTFYRTTQIDGRSIFYREAGPKDAPTLLLLHGLPSSSRMFEPLFARLSDRYH